jgi:hypothetical protein
MPGSTSLMGFARRQLNWDEFATATVNNSQQQSNSRHGWIARVFASMCVVRYCFTVLLFYCTLTSTLEYLPTARSGYR